MSRRLIRTYSSVDTYRLVRELETQVTRGQAVAIMRTLHASLQRASLQYHHRLASSQDFENQIYLYKAQLRKIRNELQFLRQNDSTNLKQDSEDIVRQVELAGHTFSEGVQSLKADISLDMNTHKNECKESNGRIESQAQQLEHRLVMQLSNIKTEIETLKVEATGNIVWMTLGCIACVMAIDKLFPTPKASIGK